MAGGTGKDELYDFLRKTVTQDETGQPVETYIVWKTAKGFRRPVRAEERFRANQELATETDVINFHYIDGVSYQDQLRRQSNDKVYDIVGIAELARRSGIEITAVATRV